MCCALQNERQTRHTDIKEHVHEVSNHLGLDLAGEFAILSRTNKLIYSVDNMILLEEAFQQVCPLLVYIGTNWLCATV